MLGEVLTAIVTPFRADGSIHLERFQEVARFLCDNGSDGVVVSGSTASISAMIRSKLSSSVSVTSDLPSRLIRFEVDSIDSMIRPFRFSFARSSSRGRRLPAATSASCSAQISTQAATFSSRVPT